MSPEVIYEDKDIVALNKPAGLLVHPIRNKEQVTSDKEAEATLVDWLLKKYPEIKTVGDDPEFRPGIVHRLDRDTSGVMLVARTQESFAYLKSLFAERKVRKVYLAWVFGKLKERKGVITRSIGIVSGSTRRSTRSEKMVKEAITRYVVEKEITKNGESFSLLKVSPETGRTHQIRVHCASIGHGIVGDVLYTRKRSPVGNRRLMLHASSIEFLLLSGSVVRLEAEPPEEFVTFVSESRDE